MADDQTQTTATPLFGGADQRCVTLLNALKAVIVERGVGLPFPAVLGTIRLLELAVIASQTAAFRAEIDGKPSWAP